MGYQKTIAVGVLLVGLYSPCIAAQAGPASKDQSRLVKMSTDACLRQGHVKQAIARYQRALSLSPTNTALYFNLAVAYHMDANTAATVSTLEKLVALDPSDGEAHYNLACLSLYQNDLEKAGRHFQKAAAFCSRDPFLAPKVLKGQTFIKDLETLDPLARKLVMLVLQKGLFPDRPI